MCIMGLFTCESSLECASVHLTHQMWHVTWISISLNLVCFCTHTLLFLLNQIASFLYDVFGAMCYFPPLFHFSSSLLSFSLHSLSFSLLQAGCSSGTQIRSTLPFGWPFFFTTQALMHPRPPLTWYPTWTTLRLPTALLWPMPVSSAWSFILDIYINAFLDREIEKGQ